MWSIRLGAVVLLCSTSVVAQEDTWDKIRYDRGIMQTSVDTKDWGNQLEVTSERITFRLKDGQGVVIPVQDVTSLSYGQEADRRLGKLGVLVAPVGVVRLVHKSRDHFIGLEFTSRGDSGRLLLQGDKDNYQAILRALAKSTGKPIAVSQEDRKFVPKEARTVIVRDEEPKTAAKR